MCESRIISIVSNECDKFEDELLWEVLGHDEEMASQEPNRLLDLTDLMFDVFVAVAILDCTGFQIIGSFYFQIEEVILLDSAI